MKMVVVDDNRQIREGIHFGIEWERYGISEIQEFADGSECLKALDDFEPDIIIADIRMPNIDGLKLLEEVRKRTDNCRYILLSAYSDFSYAQQAIRLGANDYILKPVKPEKLVEVVMKNARELLAEKTEKESYYDMFERSFLHSLENGGELEKTEKVKQFLESRYRLSLPDNCIFLAVLRVEQADGKMPKKPLQADVSEQIRAALAEEGAFFVMGPQRFLLVLRGERSQLMSLSCRYRLKNIIGKLNGELAGQNLAVTAGISDSRGMNELKAAYGRAVVALEQTYYGESGDCVLFMQNMEGEREGFPEALQKEFIEGITKSILRSDEDGLRSIMSRLKETGIEHKYPHMEMTAFLKRLYLQIVRRTELDNDPDFEKNVIENALHFGTSLKELEDYLIQFAVRKPERIPREGFSAMIKNICDYMDAHFSEQISVESVGEAFNRTPNYISSKFKREVGKSFTDYLIELRIQKAVSMLKYSDIPISEIAEKVGFSSYAYFSRTFRKHTGKNAGVYRNGQEPK